MAKSSLTERLARKGRVQTIPRVSSGNPEVVVLKASSSSPDVVAATLALVRRGTSMLKAKRAVEMALALGSAVIDLPMVEDKNILSDELGAAGIADGYEALTFEAAHPGLATRRCRALLGPARPLC